MTIASGSTFTWYPAIASTTSITACFIRHYRTRAEARSAAKALAATAVGKPRVLRIQGFDGKPNWQVRWTPRAVLVNTSPVR